MQGHSRQSGWSGLAGPLFLKAKTKNVFTKKQVINKSAWVIIGLVIHNSYSKVNRKAVSTVGRPCGRFILILTRYSIVKN